MDIHQYLDQHGHQQTDGVVSIEDYLVVSQEGFFQSVGDIFRNITKGRPPKLTNNQGRPSINRKTLENTYLNPSWLDKRRFVEGEVRVSKFGKPFMGDWNKEMRTLADNWSKQCKQNQALGKPYYDRVKPAFEFIENYQYRNPEKLAAFLDTLDLKYTKPKFIGMPSSVGISTDGAMLPALGKEGVIKLTRTIIYLCDAFFRESGIIKAWEKDYQTTLNKRWYLYSDTGAKLVAEATHRGNHDAYRNCIRLITDIADFSSRFENDYYNRDCKGYQTFQDWLLGAIAYIDASVK